MPAPGSVWAAATWDDPAWAAGTWADAVPPVAAPADFGAGHRRRPAPAPAVEWGEAPSFEELVPIPVVVVAAPATATLYAGTAIAAVGVGATARARLARVRLTAAPVQVRALWWLDDDELAAVLDALDMG